MNTIEKRSFDDGASLELYERNDSSLRIKFTSCDGDEVTLNLKDREWTRHKTLYEFQHILDRSEGEYLERLRSEDKDLPKSNFVAARILSYSSLRQPARLMAKQHDDWDSGKVGSGIALMPQPEMTIPAE